MAKARKAAKIAEGGEIAGEVVKAEETGAEVAKAGGKGKVKIESAGESGIKTVNGYDAKINVGQQNKHIPGTNKYKNALNNG